MPMPERRALLMEARAATVLDSGRDDEARLDLERAAALLPDDRHSDARALVLTTLASQRAIAGDFPGARSAAEQAVVAATAVGGAAREAAARMMLGLALVYVEGDSGLPELEAALRLAEEAADHALALRGHLNLSDALQTLGRSRESVEVAERGVELAARVGLTRSVYGVLVAMQPRRGAVPPRPLGRRAPGAHPRGGPRAGEPVRECHPRSPRPDRRARRAL